MLVLHRMPITEKLNQKVYPFQEVHHRVILYFKSYNASIFISLLVQQESHHHFVACYSTNHRQI